MKKITTFVLKMGRNPSLRNVIYYSVRFFIDSEKGGALDE